MRRNCEVIAKKSMKWSAKEAPIAFASASLTSTRPRPGANFALASRFTGDGTVEAPANPDVPAAVFVGRHVPVGDDGRDW